MARKTQRPLDHILERENWNTTRTALFDNRIAIRDSRSWRIKRELETTTDSIIPLSTVTVFDTTIVKTTFVTLHASSLASLIPTTSESRSSRSSISLPASSSSSTTSSLLASTSILLPSVIIDGPQHSLPSYTTSLKIPAVITTSSGVPESMASAFIGNEPKQRPNKTAIVGGLSGTIAGLLFIGVIVCLVLRRRRKKITQAARKDWAARDEDLSSPASRKGFTSSVVESRPVIAVTQESPAPAVQRPARTAPAVDEDHRIIRMSTCHWPRPFALGAGEGYRESVPAGKLRCTNPDPSRPGTPQSISSTHRSFFSQQRTVVGGSPRSQLYERHPLAREIPTIKVVDPALSRECVSRYSNTPSFKSYPSISTVQVVHHRTPDDPFLTPTTEEIVETGQPQRPSVARTISASISSLLNPLRDRSACNLGSDVRASSRYSVDTDSSARFSRRSDPFDLDRQSRGWTVRSDSQPGSYFGRRSQTLYEGT